jgi:hypothetical protein
MRRVRAHKDAGTGTVRSPSPHAPGSRERLGFVALALGHGAAHVGAAADRCTREVETITGRPATTVRDFIASHADRFQRPAGVGPVE